MPVATVKDVATCFLKDDKDASQKALALKGANSLSGQDSLINANLYTATDSLNVGGIAVMVNIKKLMIGLFGSCVVVTLGFALYFAGAVLGLEYLKVLLNWPVIILVIIMNFKQPISQWLSQLRIDYGGLSLSSSQQAKSVEEKQTDSPAVPQVNPKNDQTEKTEKAPDGASLEDRLRQWRANAYIWEYRYLNYYLVYNTQCVLNWLYDNNKPIDFEVIDSVWRLIIPNAQERVAIVSALQQHYLIQTTGNGFEITPKGREYVEFRGMRPTPNSSKG